MHGRNLGLLAEVARFVEKGGFEAIILKEQSATGQTIIDEFIRYTNNVRFAVVLANADDEGRLLGSEELHPRARQNVVFELGYMIGKLGRHKVAVLADETIEYPSDYSGVIYIPLKGSDDWRILLSRALKKAIPTFNSKRALGL